MITCKHCGEEIDEETEAEARADERAKIYEERKMSAPSVYKEAEDAVKINTANQIFKELDKAVWVQIEPSRLEEFYEQFSNAKDLKAALNVATAFSIIGLDAEKYEALKKKFKVD
jgi:hypothetical protein